MLGDILLGQGDTEGALAIADRALATPHISAPDYALRLKARALGMRGEYGAALEANAAAIDLRPEDARHLMDRAIILTNARRLEDALDALQSMEASDAFCTQAGMLQKPGVHFQRSNILGALGKLSEALAEMELAIEAAGGDAAGLGASYGTLLNNVGQFEKAVEVTSTYLETQPNDWYGWYVLGFAYAALRHSDDALAALDRSVALRGGQVDVSVLASRVRVRIFQTGQYGMALPDLDTMIARAPDYAPSYYYRAFALAGLRELADARKALELAVSRFPDHPLRPITTAGYAEALRMRGFAGKALAKLREARPLFVRQDYELENWRLITGSVMWAAGRPDEALALFRAASEANPENPHIQAIWLSHASFLEPDERADDVQRFVADPPVSPVLGALGERLNDDILACVLDMALHIGQAESAVTVVRSRVESPAGPVLTALVSGLPRSAAMPRQRPLPRSRWIPTPRSTSGWTWPTSPRSRVTCQPRESYWSLRARTGRPRTPSVARRSTSHWANWTWASSGTRKRSKLGFPRAPAGFPRSLAWMPTRGGSVYERSTVWCRDRLGADCRALPRGANPRAAPPVCGPLGRVNAAGPAACRGTRSGAGMVFAGDTLRHGGHGHALGAAANSGPGRTPRRSSPPV